MICANHNQQPTCTTVYGQVFSVSYIAPWLLWQDLYHSHLARRAMVLCCSLISSHHHTGTELNNYNYTHRSLSMVNTSSRLEADAKNTGRHAATVLLHARMGLAAFAWLSW